MSEVTSNIGLDHRTRGKNVSKSKEVLTTGEVARICNVAPRTVSKWFDSGQLRGYRIPGSKDRRIPLQQLIRFMKAHNIPMEGLELGLTRILIADNEADLTHLIQKALTESGDYEVRVAQSIFEAGMLMEQFRPQVLIVDIDLPGMDTRIMSRCLAGHAELQNTCLIGTSASMTETDRQALLQDHFHNTIAKPFTIRQFTEVIEETLSGKS